MKSLLIYKKVKRFKNSDCVSPKRGCESKMRFIFPKGYKFKVSKTKKTMPFFSKTFQIFKLGFFSKQLAILKEYFFGV